MEEIILNSNIYTIALEPGEKIILTGDGSLKCGDVVIRYPSSAFLHEKFQSIKAKGFKDLTKLNRKDIPGIIIQMDGNGADNISRAELLKIHDKNLVSDIRDDLLDRFIGYAENKWYKKRTLQNLASFKKIEEERTKKLNKVRNTQQR